MAADYSHVLRGTLSGNAIEAVFIHFISICRVKRRRPLVAYMKRVSRQAQLIIRDSQ